ncbi:MAG: hypothetical protein Q8N98_04440, partial [bacterium]|nr:hypothetical protein [bacterium]
MKNRLILLFGFLATALILFKPPVDPDLFWHLKNGEMMWNSGVLADFDRFSYTFSGYFFPNYSWLAELIFYAGLKTVGFLGLAIIFAVLSATAIYLSCSPLLKNPVSAVIVSLFTSLLLQPVLGVRPQTISFALFAVLWWMINKKLSARAARLGFFALFLFWANLHPGFLLGLLVLWYWKILQKDFLTPVLATLATLLNPYGPGLWSTIFTHLSSPANKNQISEWLAPNLHTFFGAALFGYFLFNIIVLLSDRPKPKPQWLAFWLCSSSLAFTGIRYVQFLPLITNRLLVLFLSGLKKNRILALFSDWPIWFLTAFVVCGIVSWGKSTTEIALSPEKLAQSGDYPLAAIKYLKN